MLEKRVNLFELLDICKVYAVADASGTYDQLITGIRGHMYDYCKEHNDGYYPGYITLEPHFIRTAKEHNAAWTFMLMNPNH